MFYDVICQKCNYKEIDFEQSIISSFPAKCPNCKKKKLIKDYSSPEALPDFHIKDIKTFGQQIEKNKKNMGNEQCELKKESMMTEFDKKKAKAKTPWWREEGSKPLDTSKIKDIKKYVETGEK